MPEDLVFGLLLSFNLSRVSLLVRQVHWLVLEIIAVMVVPVDLNAIFNAQDRLVRHQGFQVEIIQTDWPFWVTIVITYHCLFERVSVLLILVLVVLNIFEL